MTMDLKIYIPTHQRVHRQITLRTLPEDIQRESTFLVCHPSEVAQHKANGVKAAVIPDSSAGIAARRDWIMLHAKRRGFKRVMMIDDDMTWQRRRPDMRITNCTNDEVYGALKWLDKVLGEYEYAHAGFCHRALNYDNPAEYLIGSRMMYMLCYDVKKFFAHSVSFTRGMPSPVVMEDFHATLQLFARGEPNIISLEWRAAPAPSGAPGGCSAWRTRTIIERCAKTLVKLYAPHVKLRQKNAWDGGDPQTDVTVYWQKALAAGRSR